MSWRLKYTKVSCKGFGGFGTVYVVHDAWGRQFALKLLHERTHDFVRGLRKEAAKLYELLGLPGVVQLVDHDLYCDEPYIVLELAERSLHEHLGGEPQPAGLAAAIGLQLARALRDAHSRGVMHFDVKPRNVLVMGGLFGQGVLKITDFGAAKGFASVFLTMGPCGTPGYMAPEQARGQLTASADTYGLGATLYEVLTGRIPPHDRADLDPRWFAQCPNDLATLVMSMTATRPEHRPTLDAVESYCRDFMARGQARAAQQQPQRRPAATKVSPAASVLLGGLACAAFIVEAPVAGLALAVLAAITAASKR
jgi:serine/threonine protein kinase